MEGRRLIQSILEGESFERFGLYEYFWPETFKSWVDQGYPVDESGSPLDPEVHFGFDMQACGGWFDHFPIRGQRQVVQETEEWEVIRNGAGALLKYWKHKSGTPEHIDFHMISREIWEVDYRPLLLTPDPNRLSLDQDRASLVLSKQNNTWSFFGHVFLWETMRPSLGDICMFESYATDPEWIHDYHRVYTDFFKAHFDLLFLEAGLPDAVAIYEDLSYRNGLFVSPMMLAELVIPYYVELVSWLHGRGLKVHFHSCGNITQAIPLLIEAGFDSLNPMEVKAGCRLADFVREHGDRLAFLGGFDIRILETNDKSLVQRKVKEHLEEMKGLGARHIFASDHSIPPSVHYDTYRWALDAFWETCRL